MANSACLLSVVCEQLSSLLLACLSCLNQTEHLPFNLQEQDQCVVLAFVSLQLAAKLGKYFFSAVTFFLVCSRGHSSRFIVKFQQTKKCNCLLHLTSSAVAQTKDRLVIKFTLIF